MSLCPVFFPFHHSLLLSLGDRRRCIPVSGLCGSSCPCAGCVDGSFLLPLVQIPYSPCSPYLFAFLFVRAPPPRALLLRGGV